MIIDSLTEWVTVWGAATVIAIIAISACNGCCIAKILGKTCKRS